MSRELDAEIAKLMGWKFNKSSFEQYQPSSWSCEGKEVWGAHFNPSTDIAAAWTVVEKMEQDYHFNIIRNKGGEYMAGFNKDNKWYSEFADTASMAICRAAIKALGGENATR